MLKHMKEAAQRDEEHGFLKHLSTQVADLTTKFDEQEAALMKAHKERDEALVRAAAAEAAAQAALIKPKRKWNMWSWLPSFGQGKHKALEARLARAEKQLVEEREARTEAEYIKQAEDEMDHLPGDMAMKARVLRAIDEGVMGDEEREALGKMLACGNTEMIVQVDTGPRIHVWETRVSAIKNRDGCTHREAMQKARDEHPDEFDDWQAEHNGW